MGKLYLAVEGKGEVRAALNLVRRLWMDLSLPADTYWNDPPIRGLDLKAEKGFKKTCELLRKERDCVGALVLRDEDDFCPARRGPEAARWLKEACLPFPTAVVLPHKEYEAWFLPCVHLMAGKPLIGPSGQPRPGLRIGARFDGDFEGKRDVKGWLSQQFPEGAAYKPTLDQLALTRMLDLSVLRAAKMPSFGTLERALRFLAAAMPGPAAGQVYPQPNP